MRRKKVIAITAVLMAFLITASIPPKTAMAATITVDFNSLTGYSEWEEIPASTSFDGIVIDTDDGAGTVYCSSDGIGGTACVAANLNFSLSPLGVETVYIRRDDGSDFEFISIWLDDSAGFGSQYCRVEGWYDGSKTFNTTSDIDLRTAGTHTFNWAPVDEIRIVATSNAPEDTTAEGYPDIAAGIDNIVYNDSVSATPTISVNTRLTLNEGSTASISTSELSATDADTDDATLTYTITSAPSNGQLENTDNPGVAISSFTQQNLIDGKIQYVHDDSDTMSDSFTFTVSDGTNGLTGQTFSITVNAVDDNAPTVNSVSVPSNGTYTAGQNLDFTVNFNENVTVNTTGGTPGIALTIGAASKHADYVSGSGTSAIVFRYTAEAGLMDSDGIAVGALSLNSGTMSDAAGNDANLTLNSVGSTSSVLVDAVAPTVSSVNVPSNGTYTAGQNLDFTVNFNENVTVNTGGGTPRLTLTIGASTVYANYVSGSGTSATVFRYTVEAGRLDSDGISVGTLSLSGGTMHDAAGNNAVLTLNSVGSTTSVCIDAVAPTVTSVSVPSNGTYSAGQNLDFTVNFSENITVNTGGGTPRLTLTVGASTVYANYLSGSSTSALVFRYTVLSGNKDADGVALASNISLNGGTMQDAAGNNAVLTFTGSTLTNVLVKASQVITLINPGSQDFGTSPTLSATASSGLTVTFTSDTTDVCTVTSAGVLTFLKAGTATISANQAGNSEYLPATTVTQSFTVNAVVPGAPTNITAVAGDTQATVSFTAPASDGGVDITTYTVTSSLGGITASGTSSSITVTGLTNGVTYTFTVTATNSAGTGAASSASNSVTPRATQTITFGNPGAQDFGTSPTLTATSNSGLTVTFTSDTPDVCTVTSAGVLTFLKAGTATISAHQAGNSGYLPAATVTQSFTVNAIVSGAPTIGTVTAGNGKATVSFTAPAYTGGTSITGYTVTSSPGGITASGTSSPIIITGLTNGVTYTFTMTATNSAGTGAASSASSSVTPKSTQTITFGNPGTQDFGTSPTLTATSSSGLTVIFTSDTPDVCTVTSAGVMMFLKTGTATISAHQAGNSVYLPAATVTQSFTVNAVVPGAPTIWAAASGNGKATVSFTAPAYTGGTSITGYTVTSSPGGITASGTTSPIIITGLTNGVTYTFTMTATNSVGTGAASSASSSVTPKAAVIPMATPKPTATPTATETPVPSTTPAATETPVPSATPTATPSTTLTASTRTITGTLLDSDGNPMAGYTVELHSDPVITVTDANGRYAFYDVDYTSHELFVKTAEGKKIAEFELTFSEGEEFSTDMSEEGVNITYTRSTETVNIEVKLIPDQSSAAISQVSSSDNPQTSDSLGSAGTSLWWIGGGVLAAILIVLLIIILLKKKKEERQELI